MYEVHVRQTLTFYLRLLQQMPKSTKIGLCVMMSTTLLSAIVTIVKGSYLPLFTDAEDPRQSHTLTHRDMEYSRVLVYNPVPLVLWGL
jgi:hypothetical protein